MKPLHELFVKRHKHDRLLRFLDQMKLEHAQRAVFGRVREVEKAFKEGEPWDEPEEEANEGEKRSTFSLDIFDKNGDVSEREPDSQDMTYPTKEDKNAESR